jgi:hypothetical protein
MSRLTLMFRFPALTLRLIVAFRFEVLISRVPAVPGRVCNEAVVLEVDGLCDGDGRACNEAVVLEVDGLCDGAGRACNEAVVLEVDGLCDGDGRDCTDVLRLGAGVERLDALACLTLPRLLLRREIPAAKTGVLPISTIKQPTVKRRVQSVIVRLILVFMIHL